MNKKLIALIVVTFIFVANSFAAPNNSGVNSKSLELNEKGAQALQAHDTEQALKLFQQAYDIDNSNLTAAYNLAGAFVASNRESDAITLLNKVVKKYNSDAGLFARLGDVYFSNQDIDNALTAYEKTLALDKAYPNVAAKLGVIYTMKKKYVQAEKMLSSAVSESPEDARTLANYASILLINKKGSDAVGAAKKSLQHKVEATTYVTLGQAYELLKDPSNAIISYEKALALGNMTPDLRERLESLKKKNETKKS